MTGEMFGNCFNKKLKISKHFNQQHERFFLFPDKDIKFSFTKSKSLFKGQFSQLSNLLGKKNKVHSPSMSIQWVLYRYTKQASTQIRKEKIEDLKFSEFQKYKLLENQNTNNINTEIQITDKNRNTNYINTQMKTTEMQK